MRVILQPLLSRYRRGGPGPVVNSQTKAGRCAGDASDPPPNPLFLKALGTLVMEFADRILHCKDCGSDFVFTADEQVFFRSKNFDHDPAHCKPCKARRGRGRSRARPETITTCAVCGQETSVPFRPRLGRPVLCRTCFDAQLAVHQRVLESMSVLEPESTKSQGTFGKGF
jgi:CxxC-x17-CxxC domain-containing protein